MACPAMAPLVDILRDDVEAELQAIQPLPALQAAAHTWRQRLHSTAPTSLPPPCSDGAAVRWPVLSAWRWLVPLPGWEANLSTDVAGSSRVATNRERGSDLAYRGVIPRFLGVSLCNLSPLEADSLRQAELELYATLRQPGALQHELQLLSKSRTAILPAVRLTQCLLLGLRKLRQAYQARTTTWLALCRAALPAADGDMPGEGQVDDRPPLRNSSSSLTAWLQSDAGQRLIRELRWALLRPEAAAARLRSMHPCGRLSDSTIISLLLQHGGAIISETLPSWAPDLPSWSEASSALAVPCTCVPVLPAPLACCWTCGGVRLPELPIVPLPCIWCKQAGPAACVSCNITVHPRGSCRWYSGAHRAYHSSSPALQLCPDCWCTWARLLAASPRRRRPTASQELLSHLCAAAEQCQQGAGSSAVHKPALRLKHIRRWALAFIRRHGGTSVTALQQELCRREPSLADDAANRLVLSASRALCAEGHAYLERDTLCPALE